jgi:hypothetical protein
MTGYMLGGLGHPVQPPFIADVSVTDIWSSCHRWSMTCNSDVDHGFGENPLYQEIQKLFQEDIRYFTELSAAP